MFVSSLLVKASPELSPNDPCTWTAGGTVTVTDLSPVMTGAVKGMTSPLARTISVPVRVMPLGTVRVALPLALSGAPPVANVLAELPGMPGRGVMVSKPVKVRWPLVTGLPWASRTVTVSLEVGATMLRVWSDWSAPTGRVNSRPSVFSLGEGAHFDVLVGEQFDGVVAVGVGADVRAGVER